MLCSVGTFLGGFSHMELFSAPQALGSNLDDNTISVLAMLIGIVGGWMLTSLHQQLKAKRVKMSRKQQPPLRKPD
jgi:hypothetical protein